MTNKNKNMKSQNATIVLFGLVALSGCNQGGGFDLNSTGSILNGKTAPAYQHTISEQVSASDAFIQLPIDAGAVIGVSQSRYGNGVEQLIIYKGDSATRGENTALVKMGVHIDGKKQIESMTIGSVSAARISSELRNALPGVSMRISNEIHTNAYGPFGYALGRASSNVRCIYGWQQMKGSKNDRWAVLKRSSQKPKLSIRVRICRSGVTSSQLVGLMRNLRVNADPAAALRPTAVSWDAGPGGRSTGVFPQYQRSGYKSQQREAYIEADALPKHKRVVRRVAPRRVTKAAKVFVEQPQSVPVAGNFNTRAASMPLPEKYSPSGSRAVGNVLVPVPPGGLVDRPRVKPAVTSPLVTARTYQHQPITARVPTVPAVVTGSHSAVPLPN